MSLQKKHSFFHHYPPLQLSQQQAVLPHCPQDDWKQMEGGTESPSSSIWHCLLLAPHLPRRIFGLLLSTACCAGAIRVDCGPKHRSASCPACSPTLKISRPSMEIFMLKIKAGDVLKTATRAVFMQHIKSYRNFW